MVARYRRAKREVGEVQALFATSHSADVVWVYDLSDGGQRFLINTVVEQRTLSPITLVVNWTAGRERH